MYHDALARCRETGRDDGTCAVVSGLGELRTEIEIERVRNSKGSGIWWQHSILVTFNSILHGEATLVTWEWLCQNDHINVTHFALAIQRKCLCDRISRSSSVLPFLSHPQPWLSSSLTPTIAAAPTTIILWSTLHAAAREIFSKTHLIEKDAWPLLPDTNPRLLTLASEYCSFYFPLLWNMLIYPRMTLRGINWKTKSYLHRPDASQGCPLPRKCPQTLVTLSMPLGGQGRVFATQWNMALIHSLAHKLLLREDEDGARSCTLGISLVWMEKEKPCQSVSMYVYVH